MSLAEMSRRLQRLAEHAWDQEVRWPHMLAWADNFQGRVEAADVEQLHALFVLTRFIYFGKRMMREMLRSLYRDHFEAPLIQRIRRNYGGTKDIELLRRLYKTELQSTRFLGIGNPSESGAHLLYYFRQVNHLDKDLFADLSGAFRPQIVRRGQLAEVRYVAREAGVLRYVFFDDLVGSGSQASSYLSDQLPRIRRDVRGVELKMMALFATTKGLERLNSPALFDGGATCLFELDDSYKAFSSTSRYFNKAPPWLIPELIRQIAQEYGEVLQPGLPLGYKDGQLLLGFSHNTPDNTLPIFWDEGRRTAWSPIFVRFDKAYS